MKKVHIYIDESEINGTIVLGAIIVPEKHIYTLDRRLTDLRRQMLREMQRHNYPILNPALAHEDKYSRQKTERIRLAAGGLPEIHAAELWSSDIVFWKERDGTPVLMERHRNWLNKALALIEEFGIQYHRNVLRPEVQVALEGAENDIYNTIKPYLTKDIQKDKVSKLQKDPYIRLLFGLIQGLDRVAEENKFSYKVICDSGKKNEMFKTFETFTLLKQYGSWQRLDNIDFQDSHSNTLIQLCDVVTYFDTKADYLEDGHRDKGPAKVLRNKYFRRAWRRTPRPEGPTTEDGFFLFPSLAYAELMAMFTEMALLHSGGQQKTLPERRRRLQEVMKQFPDVFQRNYQIRIKRP